jgi:hypothetical protein
MLEERIMNEKVELEIFLSKLTVLCRQHNVELYALKHSSDSGSSVQPLSFGKKDWIYKIAKSSKSPDGHWELLCLTNDSIEESLINTLDKCLADEQHIKLLEAGLG